tara:strand:+ start:446 stop:802 length:357 start_codon:yes stop_codon:yes gene_type:complete
MIKLSSLNSDIEFKKLLKLKKIHNNYFTIYFGKIYTDDTNKKLKISFVAKKKIGNAVKRNKIKRKLRSAVQKNLNKNILKKKNYAYLMIARSQTYKEKFSIISEQINKTFEKIERIIN